MTTFGELKNRVLRLLSDPSGAGYSDDLILDAISAAHDGILPWVPKTGSTTLTGDGVTAAFSLPSNFYAVEAIVDDSTGELLPQSVLTPGRYFGDSTTNTNDWILNPSGQITFSKEISSGCTYTLMYLATWSKPVSGSPTDLVLEPPASAIVGMSLYAAAYALLPSAVSASEVRQFNTRVDSGNPEHNPMQRAADYLMKLFANEMNRHPKYQRAQV